MFRMGDRLADIASTITRALKRHMGE